MNGLGDGDYVQVVEFLSDVNSFPAEESASGRIGELADEYIEEEILEPAE